MALSGSFGLNNTGGSDFRVTLYWSATQNVTSNTSTIKVWLSVACNADYPEYNTSEYGVAKMTIGNYTVQADIRIPFRDGNTATGGAIERTVSHNSGGYLNISVGGSINYGVLGASGSQTISLNRIIRPVTILTAPNFNDEENPTITYKSYMTPYTTHCKACISLNGSEDIKYRDIDMNAGSYTFELTEDERNLLRKATTGSNSRTIRFYIMSVIDGVYKYSNVSRTYTIINGNPVIYPTVEDTDVNTLFLTGDKNTLIKYYSDAYIESNAGAVKEATLTETSITNGGKTEKSLHATFTNVESGVFSFTATDNRGNTTTQTIEKPFINYIKLTANMDVSAPTTGGVSRMTVSGNYYNGTFGKEDNVLILVYRYKVGDVWSEWASGSNVVLNGNTYSATFDIKGLNYRNKYTFQARVADMLETVESNTKAVRTTPVFDWGENDFQFNVPVKFNAGMENHNVLLWQGAYFMTANQTANLASPVSAQNNGIVLVFSNYDTTNSQANDYDWHCYFVPKYLVDIKDGTGHCFNMMSQSFGDICSKYIYISDTGLTGHDNNTKSATNNGINYSNAKYVLRYIFGV